MTEKFWAIRKCDLFSKLSETECERIERVARLRTWPKDSPIYLPSDSADHVFLLATGRVKLSSVTPEGKQAIMGFIEAGDLFGEFAAFETSVREELASAVKKSTVVMIPADDFGLLMESSPKFTLSLSRLMGLRRNRIERRLRSLLFRSSRDRLIHLLVEQLDEALQKSGGQDPLIRLSHHDLASLIGSTRETVTATLGELQTLGYVELQRQKIKITNRSALVEIAQITEPNPSSYRKSATENQARNQHDPFVPEVRSALR
jgi:CRP-like cAMP-binding protein